MKTTKILLMISAVLIMAGCGKDSPTFSLLPDGQTFKQSSAVFNNQLDILWVIDNSGSMEPYQNNLITNFSSFITNFQAKGYDFRVAVSNTGVYTEAPGYQNIANWGKFKDGTDQYGHTGIFTILPSTPNLNNVFVTNAHQGANGPGDERAFQSMQVSLDSPSNSGFLRPNSFLAVIILSDEDDFSNPSRAQNFGADHNYSAALPTSNYVSYLDTLTHTTGASRRYNVSSIAVIDAACQQAHAGTGSIMGQRYIELSNATNGVLGSICDASFATTLNLIQDKIATLSSRFFLDRTPDPATITVKVNGASISNSSSNGWTYVADGNFIEFHGSAIPPQNATIQINFVPTTIR